jgi:hypothetical protein
VHICSSFCYWWAYMSVWDMLIRLQLQFSIPKKRIQEKEKFCAQFQLKNTFNPTLMSFHVECTFKMHFLSLKIILSTMHSISIHFVMCECMKNKNSHIDHTNCIILLPFYKFLKLSHMWNSKTILLGHQIYLFYV